MKKIMILMICLVLLAPLAFTNDYGDDPDPGSVEPRYYDNAKVLRVKYTQGEGYVKRSYDEGFEEAAINLPIFEKDIVGTTDGRLEIYLGRLNYLRLDNDTEVTFDKVPELQKTDFSLRVIRGGIYLDVENLDYERDIEVQTPDCGVFLLDKGAYRINVNEGGRTEVYVYDGIAEVAGDNYSRNVRENQKIVMFDGGVKERPFYFYSTDKDDFDRWSQERNSQLGYARYGSSQYLDSGYEEYEHELSHNGRWKYDSAYSTYIWIPYSVGIDWRPYYHGRWVWNPYYGYVWSSFDSWGYFTHHYGRWHWDPIYHWYWIPGYRWSPAWVSWFWDDHYYGWSPLSRWNRPVVVYNGHWWRNHHYRKHGIPFYSRSTIIIRKGNLTSSGIHRVALRKGETAKLSKKTLLFKGNSPNIRPTFSKVNVINAKGKQVVYKKNGLVSFNRYKLDKNNDGLSKTNNKTTIYKYSGKTISKKSVSKYSHSPYSQRTHIKSKSYTPSTSRTGQSSETMKIKKYSSTASSGYKSSTKYSSGSASKSRSYTSSSSRSRSSTRSKIKKSPTKSSSSKSKSSSSKKSSGSKAIKKKKNEPSYSYNYKSSGSSSYASTSPYSSKSYSSKATYTKKTSSYSYPSQSNNSYRYRSHKTDSYNSSYTSSYRKPTRSSYKSYSPSYNDSRSSTSYKSSSQPSLSYSKSGRNSSYRSSSKNSSSRVSRSKSGSSSSSSSKRTSSSRSGSSKSSSIKRKSK